MSDIDNRLGDVAYTMTKQIDGNHRKGMPVLAVLDDILLAAVLGSEILTEAQRLRLYPCLLQLYEDKMLTAILLAYRSTKVNAEHRDVITRGIDILMGTLCYLDDILLQQSGKDGACDTFILHQILEHSIIYGICNVQFHNIPLFISIVMILHCKNTRFVALMQQITCFATLICNFLTLTRMPQSHHVPQIIVVFISIDIISRIRYICEILNFSK